MSDFECERRGRSRNQNGLFCKNNNTKKSSTANDNKKKHLQWESRNIEVWEKYKSEITYKSRVEIFKSGNGPSRLEEPEMSLKLKFSTKPRKRKGIKKGKEERRKRKKKRERPYKV